MRQSRLPEGGTNRFQVIKELCVAAEKNGTRLLKLSIGQPSGPALEGARSVAAQAILSAEQSMHEYQDNGCLPLPSFAQRFVQAHVRSSLDQLGPGVVDYLPIPGIKPMLGLIPLACGTNPDVWIQVYTATDPGYPTPADWCEYLGNLVDHCHLTLSSENSFRPILEVLKGQIGDLVMINYPHNPSGQVASREWLEALCAFCVKYDIRIFNDAAYSILAHSHEHCTLADVALGFPELSWVEAYSASKAGNFTGWRIGALIGSPDFIGDIRKIKGNTDSGFAAPLAIGVLHAFENERESIEAVRTLYEKRLRLLIKILASRGMRLAVEPKAGFFSLWQAPNRAFGEAVESAEHFNSLMIERTGVVGVHFDPYIRYAVCGDVEGMADEIDAAFAMAHVAY